MDNVSLKLTGPPDAGNNLRRSHFILCHVTKYATIRGVFQQPWPGVSPTAILNEEEALGTRLGFFFLTRGWGLALVTHAQCRFFKLQMFILIHFTNLSAQNATKQRKTKYHPQKSLSNNGRSVVKSPPLSVRGRMVFLIWRTKRAHTIALGKFICTK